MAAPAVHGGRAWTPSSPAWQAARLARRWPRSRAPPWREAVEIVRGCNTGRRAVSRCSARTPRSAPSRPAFGGGDTSGRSGRPSPPRRLDAVWAERRCVVEGAPPRRSSPRRVRRRPSARRGWLSDQALRIPGRRALEADDLRPQRRAAGGGSAGRSGILGGASMRLPRWGRSPSKRLHRRDRVQMLRRARLLRRGPQETMRRGRAAGGDVAGRWRGAPRSDEPSAAPAAATASTRRARGDEGARGSPPRPQLDSVLVRPCSATGLWRSAGRVLIDPSMIARPGRGWPCALRHAFRGDRRPCEAIARTSCAHGSARRIVSIKTSATSWGEVCTDATSISLPYTVDTHKQAHVLVAAVRPGAVSSTPAGSSRGCSTRTPGWPGPDSAAALDRGLGGPVPGRTGDVEGH